MLEGLNTLDPNLVADIVAFVKAHPAATGALVTWSASDHALSSLKRVKANNTLQLIWHGLVWVAKLVLKLNELRKRGGKDGEDVGSVS